MTTELLDANVVTSEVVSANVVTSEVDDVWRTSGVELHKPVLDIDMPCVLTESSTPGHHHLYVDKAMTWDHYSALLTVLGQCGILEDGYVQSALRRKYTAVRLPWVRKGDEESELDMAMHECAPPSHPRQRGEHWDCGCGRRWAWVGESIFTGGWQ